MASFVVARYDYSNTGSGKAEQMEELNWKQSADHLITGLLSRPSIQKELSVDYNIRDQSLIFKARPATDDSCSSKDNSDNLSNSCNHRDDHNSICNHSDDLISSCNHSDNPRSSCNHSDYPRSSCNHCDNPNSSCNHYNNVIRSCNCSNNLSSSCNHSDKFSCCCDKSCNKKKLISDSCNVDDSAAGSLKVKDSCCGRCSSGNSSSSCHICGSCAISESSCDNDKLYKSCSSCSGSGSGSSDCGNLSNGVSHRTRKYGIIYSGEQSNGLNIRMNGRMETREEDNLGKMYSHEIIPDDTKLDKCESSSCAKSSDGDKSSDSGISSRCNSMNRSSYRRDYTGRDRCNPFNGVNEKICGDDEIYPVTTNTCVTNECHETIGRHKEVRNEDRDTDCKCEGDTDHNCHEGNNNIACIHSAIALDKAADSSYSRSTSSNSSGSSDSSWTSFNHDDLEGTNKKNLKSTDKQLFDRGLELFRKFRSRTNSSSSISSLLSNGSYSNSSNSNNNICIINGIRYNAECMKQCKTERFIVTDRDRQEMDFLFPACSSDLDISTGHLVLEYMENHLTNQDRLDQEWADLCRYVPDAPFNSTSVALELLNARKNRTNLAIPYDHTRVRLERDLCVSNSDYINAAYIKDHDPRKPCYIATQGPLPHTVADFWQMIWEQECSVIVNLTSLVENDVTKCHQYWPQEGCDIYHVYEVHLVSEHIHCDGDDDGNDDDDDDDDDDGGGCVIRSFFLKNIRTGGTRTVTQYQYLGWADHQLPASTTSLREFRRKVRKSLGGMSSPMVVHCSDGGGRTGTYCLLDLVLSRLSKGVKEIDISATLEHLRDQYTGMVETKEQFEFVLLLVAEEVEQSIKSTHRK